MNLSVDVPTYPVDGEFITATKAGGTAYDDLAVKGIQIFGDQTTSGNNGAIAYITGSNGNLILSPHDSVYISSLFVSTLTANTIISTSATTGTSLTLTSFLSSATVITGNISTNSISTSQIRAQDIFTSTLTVSTLNAPNFVVSTINTSNISSVLIDTKVTLTSTLTLFGISSVSLGLGDVIQGLVGGAASQGLGAVLGGAALATGVAALVTGRTSGGVNSNVFQTVNGSTQLQFSTIGAAVSSVFLTTDSALPLTTPGVPIRQEIGVPAGTLCIRSVGDPLNVIDNISAIQMFGQWVPVPGGGGGSFTIPSSIFLSTVNVDGNLVQSGNGTFNWGGNTMSPTQVVLARPTSVNNTLTTTGAAFLNAGATVNNGLTVASGPTNLNTGLTVGGGVTQMTNSLTVFGQVAAQAGLVVNGGNAQFNGPAIATNTFSANGLATLNGGVRTPAISTINISTGNINVNTINNAAYPPPAAPTVIPSSIFLSTVNVDGNLVQSGIGTFNWAGNTMSPTQVVLTRPTSVNTTLTTTGGAFLNAGATVNSGLTVASGVTNINAGLTVGGGLNVNSGSVTIQGGTQIASGLTVFGLTAAQAGLQVNGGNAQFNGPTIATNTFSVSGLATLNGGATINGTANFNGNLNANTLTASGSASLNGGLNTTTINATTVNANTTMISPTATHCNVTLSSINGAVYPPTGSVSIPSTLQASTITFNGGLSNIGTAPLFSAQINATNMSNSDTITSVNVNATNMRASDFNLSNNGGTITGNGQIVFQLAPGAAQYSFRNSAGTNTSYIAEFYANQTSRFFSTLTIRDNTFPIIGPSFARVQTYDPSYDSQPWGSVLTSNVSTTTAFFNTGFTNLLNAASISSVNTRAINIGASTIAVSSITGNTLNAISISTINLNATSISSVNLNATSISTTNLNARFLNTSTLQTSSITTDGMQMKTNLQFFQGPGQPEPLAEIQAFGNNLVTTLATTSGATIWQFGYGGGAAPILALSNSGQTARMYGTLSVRDTNAVNQAVIQTYNRGAEVPMGEIFTSTISTVTLNTATLNSITGNMSSLTVSSINNAIYPPILIPVGGVMIWAGIVAGSVPSGWLICDGSLVSKTTYANLYAAIGDSYYNGKTTGIPYDANSFFLPDLTFAIPQGAPTPTYSCSVFAVTYPYPVVGFPAPVSSNSYWALGANGDQTAGTINIGTYFPPGSVPGAPAGIGYRIARVLGLGFNGNPDLIEVIADDNSAVPNISTLTTISSIGVYRDNGASPVKYWRPGTFNDSYQGNPPTLLEQPTRNLFQQLDATNVPAHQHLGKPDINSTALSGASFQVGSPTRTGTETSVQTNATQLNGTYSAAPFFTHPHVLNMFYIIKI
jgi:hypothetical protein